MGEKSTMKKSVPWLYFIALFAQMIGGTIATTYLVFYMTSRMLIAAAVMGTILLISRIVDLVIGLLAGAVVQKLCFKNGQYRFWLLYGPLAVSVGTTLCFINPAIPMMAKAVIVFLGYILYGAGMSFIQVSQNGLMTKIAGPNMEDRLALTSKMLQGQNTGTIVASLITLPLIMWVDTKGVDGYTVIQIIFACIGFVGQLFLFLGTKEFDKYTPDFKSMGGASVKTTKMISETLKNGQIIIVLLAEMFRWGIVMTILSLAMYYFSYVVDQPLMMTTSMTVQSVLALLCSFIAPAIVKKIGKKHSAIVTGIFGFVGYGCIALLGMKGAVYYVIFNAVAIAGSSLINVCGVNLFLDCAEYQLYKTGRDNRTFAMSLYGIAIKLGFIISSVVTAGVLSAVDYDEIQAVIGSPQTFVYLLGGIPAAANLIYVLLYTFGYKITEDKSKEYAEANFTRAQKNLSQN